MHIQDSHQQESSTQSTPKSNTAEEDGGKKKKTTKRRKVNHACLYCRRSHMTCDEGRPCQRWYVLVTLIEYWTNCLTNLYLAVLNVRLAIYATTRGGRSQLRKVLLERLRRVIMQTSHTHMRQVSIIISSRIAVPNSSELVTVYQNPQLPNATPAWPASVPPQNTNFLYQPETLGNEFSVLRHVFSNQGV